MPSFQNAQATDIARFYKNKIALTLERVLIFCAMAQLMSKVSFSSFSLT
jgi:hypothetical protein